MAVKVFQYIKQKKADYERTKYIKQLMNEFNRVMAASIRSIG